MTEEEHEDEIAKLKVRAELWQESKWLNHLRALRVAQRAQELGMELQAIGGLMGASVRQVELWQAEAEGRTLGWEGAREDELLKEQRGNMACQGLLGCFSA